MALGIGIARVSANAAEICGDAAHAWITGADTHLLIIVDGLGHGREAAVAASAAVDHVARHPDHDLPALFKGMTEALAPTRGAAVGVARIDTLTGRVSYAAVGNTRAAVFGWQSLRLDSAAGIVGKGGFHLSVREVTIRPGNALVLWTDGVEERLTLPPGSDPSPSTEAVAGSLLRKYRKGGDDACVLVARFEAGQ